MTLREAAALKTFDLRRRELSEASLRMINASVELRDAREAKKSHFKTDHLQSSPPHYGLTNPRTVTS